jgi:CheY-like chemotaxis protein
VQRPLALILYEKLMPGSLLINRLQDLNYRVISVPDAGQLADIAETEGPMLILADMDSSTGDVGKVISQLRQNPATAHIPVIAFADEAVEHLMVSAQEAGAKLVVTNTAIVAHLPQLLEQALQED